MLHIQHVFLNDGSNVTMNRKNISTLLLIILVCMLTACQNVKEKKKAANLEESVTSYEVALRWAEHESAYSYHVSPDGTRPAVDLDGLKEISVTGIEVFEKLVNETKDEAIIRMEVKYYFKDQGTVRTLKLEQLWWYSEENEQWFIKSDFPPF